MRLRYTLQGAAELDAILTHIKERSSIGGYKVQRRLQEMTELILRYPQIGKPTRNHQLRRLSATPYPYVIFYQATEGEIIIHGIRHSARNPSTMPGH